MTLFQTLAALLTLAALASYLNDRFFRLPPTIGLMTIALVASLLLVIAGEAGVQEVQQFARFVAGIDFSEALFHGMLPFLLFAGALHVDLNDLRQVKWTVTLLSTLGTVLSTFLVGALFWACGHWLGYDLPLVYALLFGALISPTDPIAVLGIIKKAGAPKELETRITGESLFNDGVGVVLFLALLGMLGGRHTADIGALSRLFLQEALGGIALGWALGWVVFQLLRTVNNYPVEILMSLALCSGAYALAERLQVSGPLAVVVAGLFTGNKGWEQAMSAETQASLGMFWQVIDEILNSLLFVLVGLEIAAIRETVGNLALGLSAVACVLASRWISVALPMRLLGIRYRIPRGTILLLTWGGLRGALSIALALLLPHGPMREPILTATYVVVIFSILVQGLTFGPLLRRTARRASQFPSASRKGV